MLGWTSERVPCALVWARASTLRDRTWAPLPCATRCVWVRGVLAPRRAVGRYVCVCVCCAWCPGAAYGGVGACAFPSFDGAFGIECAVPVWWICLSVCGWGVMVRSGCGWACCCERYA